MDPAVERAVAALADLFVEFAKAWTRLVVALAAAAEAIGLAFATTYANVYAGQVQRSPDIDAEWRRLWETWTTTY